MFSTYIGKNSPIFTIWSCVGLGCQNIWAMNVFNIYREKFPYFHYLSCVGSGCQIICAMNVFNIYREKFSYFHYLKLFWLRMPDHLCHECFRHIQWKVPLFSLSEVVLAQDARPFVPWMFSLYIGENSPIFTFCRMPDHLSQMERIISRTDSTTAENIYSTDGILWGIQTLQSVHCTVQSSHCTYCTLWGTYVVNCTDCALYV